MGLRSCTRSASGGRCALLLVACALFGCGDGDPLARARAYHSGGEHEKVVEVLGPLIDGETRDPEVLYLYGVNQRLAGRPGLALWALHEGRRAEGWEVSMGLELATAAHDARAWPTAIEAATRVIEREPDNLYAYAVRAEARMQARTNYEGALADLERAIELDPENAALRLGRVGILLRLSRVQEAGEILRRIDEIATPESFSIEDRAGLCVARALFERESGHLERASEAFEACYRQYPQSPRVVIAMVEHYDALGRHGQGRGNEILTELVANRPFEFVPRAQLARRLHAMGARAEAERLLLEGGELPHPFAAAHALSTLAELYVSTQRFADAARVFGRARKLEGERGPQRILAHAELLALAGQREPALELAEELGDHVYRHLVYAVISFSERDARRALSHLETALVQWPDNAAAQYYAGRAAERLGDFARAVDAYRNSIRAGAGHTDAGVKLALLHRAAGRDEEAHVAVHHHLKEHADDLQAALLAVELATRLEPKRLQASLAAVPEDRGWGRVGALLSEVAAERAGAEAGVELLRRDTRLDLESPEDAAAIAALVRHLRASQRDAEARAVAERLVARAPEDARSHWVLSLASDREASQRALARAVALDPSLEPAVRAHARHRAGSGDVVGAVASLEAFVRQSPEVLLEMAALLLEAGQPDAAEQRLETLLWEQPHHADAARELARLRLSRDAGREPRTLELALRSVRFGGGAEAYHVLARVLRARGERERAEEAQRKARQES